jgi:hypothetical protein
MRIGNREFVSSPPYPTTNLLSFANTLRRTAAFCSLLPYVPIPYVPSR